MWFCSTTGCFDWLPYDCRCFCCPFVLIALLLGGPFPRAGDIAQGAAGLEDPSVHSSARTPGLCMRKASAVVHLPPVPSLYTHITPASLWVMLLIFGPQHNRRSPVGLSSLKTNLRPRTPPHHFHHVFGHEANAWLGLFKQRVRLHRAAH